jgi:hypothetical protein
MLVNHEDTKNTKVSSNTVRRRRDAALAVGLGSDREPPTAMLRLVVRSDPTTFAGLRTRPAVELRPTPL